ncbi:Crp/Fnr family transcriptional regulator [Dyadobacter aurulentus]|uniref:Crp/Fnr family transcriptional regulator n=1 Tax=Dyadobacter sp. UC 10 TaxID=2605428 RepID=UPI0011F30F44|nr:Crp/Fnr family transcriptional regulator [Dyadobacter sp. UC 10]KAA0992240.1 Crp/Fnr family transcriptional regulator [Dyadobacter sp. UC 10]
MYDAFFDYLKRYSSEPLSEDEMNLIRQALTPFKLRKRQYFLQAGDVCKNFAFITHGAMRQYMVDDKGTEHVARLGIENWWMGDRESFLMNTPSAYHIDAWENTEMLLINKAATDELIRKVPAYCEMTREMDNRNNIANQRRITSSISFTAEKRYADLFATYPELIERFPQHVIASYLGITKDTLSRVKRQLLRK